MAGGQVGRLSIRVLPDTRKFREDLRKSLNRIEKSVKATIQVRAELSKSSLADVKRQVEELDATIKATVDASGARESVERIRRQVEDTRAQVKATVDAEGVRASVERIRQQIEGTRAQVDAKVRVDKSSLAVANAELGALSRTRIVKLVTVVLAAKGATQLGGLLAPSTGLALADMSKNLTNMVRNLDRAAPGMAKLATSLGVISSISLAGLSNGLTIVGDLSKLGGLALTLPAVAAGLGTIGGILKAVLPDAGAYVGDLVGEFAALQDAISPAFWGQAEQGIRHFTAGFIPLATTWLPRISAGLGDWVRSLAATVASENGLRSMAVLFENLSVAVEKMSTGWAYLGTAMMTLIEAGSKFLPRMGQAFTDMMQSFASWSMRIASDGTFDRWVEGGITALKQLGSVIGSTFGILGSLTQAARAAGSTGLGGLAAGLSAVNAALAGPVWQGALTTIFQGAHDSMERMRPGLAALAGAFISLAPVMAEIMRLSGEIANSLLTGIAQIAQNPTFQRGLVALFEGARSAAASLLSVAPQIAEKIGLILETAGLFASTLGTTFATAVRELAPVLTSILTALQALIPVMGEMLVGAIQAVAPLITAIVTTISALVQASPQLVGGLLLVVGAIGTLAGILGALTPVILTFTEGFGVLATVARFVVTALGFLVTTFGLLPVLIGAALIALVAVVVMNWDAIVAAVQGATQAIMDWIGSWLPQLVQSIADGMNALGTWWSEGWASMGQQLNDAWTSFAGAVSAGVDGIVGFFAELPSRLLGALGDLGGLLAGAGHAIMDGFLGGLRAKWGDVQDFVNGIAGWIAAHKGPISYDRTLLVPAGHAIMGGFNKALQRGVRAVRSTVLGIAPMIERAMAPVDLGAKLDAQMASATSSMSRVIAGAGEVQVSASDVDATLLDRSTLDAAAMADALNGMAVKINDRELVGALVNSRAGKALRR